MDRYVLVSICLLAGLACTKTVPTSIPLPSPNIQQTVEAAIQGTMEAFPPPTSTPIPPTETPIPEPTSMPLPTPSPIPTAMPTPTSTPMATPTAIPTPTSLPTPTPTFVPTPTPTPVPPPLELVFNRWEDDGILNLSLIVTNLSDKVVDAYEVEICPKDSLGQFIGRPGNECLLVSSDTVIHPRSADPPLGLNPMLPGFYYSTVTKQTWQQKAYPIIQLYSYGTATQADFELIRVHFQDGTVWKKGDVIAGK